MGEADAVPLGIEDVQGVPGAMDDGDAEPREPILPRRPLAGGDRKRDEMQPGPAVDERPRLGRRTGALEREERRRRTFAEREPDAAIAALLARPALQDGKAEDIAVEPLARGEIGALDREVVERAHRRSVTGTRATGYQPRARLRAAVAGDTQAGSRPRPPGPNLGPLRTAPFAGTPPASTLAS